MSLHFIGGIVNFVLQVRDCKFFDLFDIFPNILALDSNIFIFFHNLFNFRRFIISNTVGLFPKFSLNFVFESFGNFLCDFCHVIFIDDRVRGVSKEFAEPKLDHVFDFLDALSQHALIGLNFFFFGVVHVHNGIRNSFFQFGGIPGFGIFGNSWFVNNWFLGTRNNNSSLLLVFRLLILCIKFLLELEFGRWFTNNATTSSQGFLFLIRRFF